MGFVCDNSVLLVEILIVYPQPNLRCVFPAAFAYTWEPAIGRYGKQRKDEFELHVTPNMSYSEDMANGKTRPAAEEQAAPFIKLGPREQTERKQIFKGLLTSMVRDSHTAFLRTLGLEIKESEVTRWHDVSDYSFEALKLCTFIIQSSATTSPCH